MNDVHGLLGCLGRPVGRKPVGRTTLTLTDDEIVRIDLALRNSIERGLLERARGLQLREKFVHAAQVTIVTTSAYQG